MNLMYDELVERVASLADENGNLLSKCRALEEAESERESEDAELMKDMQEENEALHQSLMDAMAVAEDMSERMGSYDRLHLLKIAEYEDKLAALTAAISSSGKLDDATTAASNDDGAVSLQDFSRLTTIDEEGEVENALREENGALRSRLNDARNAARRFAR